MCLDLQGLRKVFYITSVGEEEEEDEMEKNRESERDRRRGGMMKNGCLTILGFIFLAFFSSHVETLLNLTTDYGRKGITRNLFGFAFVCVNMVYQTYTLTNLKMAAGVQRCTL